jgi:O-acetyl-ADP-ribose deacetylase (regulator of RNase III)
LTHACDEIGRCPVGEAVITEGFRLPAKFIIHTPGPIWRGGTHQESELLKNCYLHSLELAKQCKCDSIAFPLISTGIYSYPKEEALQIAISSISSFLLHHDIHVYLVVFDKASFGLSQKLFYSIHEYIDEHYVKEVESTFHRRQNRFELESLQEPIDIEEKPSELIIESNLVDLVEELDESFSARLLRLIDEKGMTDVETYRRANIDRRLFSKIRNKVDYLPTKKTALAFAIALQLNVEETNELLSAAGYVLSHSSKSDVIIEFFIKQGSYDIHEINEALFAFDQPLLGV